MATEVVPIRFPKEDIKTMDLFVGEGEFKSRSEMIRYAVKRTISDLYAKKLEEEILKRPETRKKTDEQILRELREIRKELWGKKRAKGVSGH